MKLAPAALGRPRSTAGVIGFYIGTLVFFATACAEPDLEVLRVSEPSRDSDGPYGVGFVERDFRVRVDETVTTDIYLPLEPAERHAANRASPVVLSLHGGLVSPRQYRWLNMHIASRGYVVLAPHHALELAIFEQGNALDVLEAARHASRRRGDLLYERLAEGPGLAVGHSLGGVVAAHSWLEAPADISHLILLASEPNEADAVQRRDDQSAFVLSLTGERDGLIDPDRVAEGARRFEVPTSVAVVDGMNHFQFVENPTASQRDEDGRATVDTERARRLVLQMVDEVLKSYSTGEDDFWRDPTMWPEGVSAYEN